MNGKREMGIYDMSIDRCPVCDIKADELFPYELHTNEDLYHCKKCGILLKLIHGGVKLIIWKLKDEYIKTEEEIRKEILFNEIREYTKKIIRFGKEENFSDAITWCDILKDFFQRKHNEYAEME